MWVGGLFVRLCTMGGVGVGWKTRSSKVVPLWSRRLASVGERRKLNSVEHTTELCVFVL